MKRFYRAVAIFLLAVVLAAPTRVGALSAGLVGPEETPPAFHFVFAADSRDNYTVLPVLSHKMATLAPAFGFFGGDLCGTFDLDCINNQWKPAMDGNDNDGMLARTFVGRGNHDNGSLAAWQGLWDFQTMATSVGATNYSAMTEDATYSFDYANSHFVMVDLPLGGSSTWTPAQISWLDADLTAAEKRGAIHEFLFGHAPMYAVTTIHGGEEPTAALKAVLNSHPISAAFHGHEHITAYTHVTPAVEAGITDYEQFTVGRAGAPPQIIGRPVEWSADQNGFADVAVNGNDFTVTIYGESGSMLFSKTLSQPTGVHVYIGGSHMNGYSIHSGDRVTPRYSVLNGPVNVWSTQPVLTSERVHNKTGFVNEVMGVPDSQLTNEYWFPWYDNLTMQTWILVGNPSTTDTAHVHIYVAGEDMNPLGYEIGHGGRITPRYPRLNGPVRIVSDINVFASERVHTSQGFVQETMGYPNNQLASKYWFPWYDDKTMTSWILVGNPSETLTARVHIYIAGEDMNPEGYDIGPGDRITPTFDRLNGPVLIDSDNPVFASERVHNAKGFVQETMGYPDDQLTTEYWFPWYDNLSMSSWILVGNPSDTLTAHVHIYIGGTDMNPAGYDIRPGGRLTRTFAVLNGPVHIVSDNQVFTSERVHTAQGFVQETMGIPNDQLTAEYWFPWYDNLSMSSWLLVGAP